MQKPVKNKKCKVCEKEFNPYRSTQNVCSNKCAIIYAKQKKAKKEAYYKTFEIEIINEKTLKALLHNTRIQVHSYIRERDKGKPCISCGKAWDSSFQAGHFYKAELYSNLKFNFNNIHGQCEYCNTRLEGNINAYTLNLPKRIGQSAFDELNRLATEYKKSNFKWNIENLKQILAECKELKNKLKKSK